MSALNASRLSILVIDDNKDAADTVAILIRYWGFDVSVAYTATQGLRAARSHRPDCVLSDIGLPDFDGYELAKQFSEDRFLRSIPLIAVTANPDEDRASSAGFMKVFTKPTNLATLELLLRSLAG